MRLAVLIDGYFWHACPGRGTTLKWNNDSWSEILLELESATLIRLRAYEDLAGPFGVCGSKLTQARS